MAPVLLPLGSSFRDDFSLSAWLDQNPDVLLIMDAGGTIAYVNPAFESLSGYGRAEAVGQKCSILDGGTHDADLYRGMAHAFRAGVPHRAVFLNRRKNGEPFHAESVIWPVFDTQGCVQSYACHMRDATERLQALDRLSHAATHDPLTDLPNRSLFLDRLKLALRQAARRGEEVAVAIMDIDRFKNANTRHGHQAGDAVLQAVATRSTGCVRATDTVARIGGDELALILPAANGRAGTEVLEKVRAGNAQPVPYEGCLIRTSVSVGVCIYPHDGSNARTLCRNADSAMYAAKRAGGNCVRFYRADGEGGARRRRNSDGGGLASTS